MDAAKRQIIAASLANIVKKARRGGPLCRIGLMAAGSELGQEEILAGGVKAQRENPGLQVVAIGPRPGVLPGGAEDLDWIESSDCESDIAAAMNAALTDGVIAGAVAMHFPFPIGVATIGRILTPAKGKPMLIASCTGSTSAVREESLLRNAVYGIATAKACGIGEPTLAFLNVDGAGPVLRALGRMQERGYRIHFGKSKRGDGGTLLRGNDLVSGAVDVLVCDTLVGNALVKIFSTFTTGGQYESQGWGYGPSVGEGWKKIISIVSRASGAPVIANALALTARAAAGNLSEIVEKEIHAAKMAGLDREIEEMKPKKPQRGETVAKPAVVPVDAEIAGVDVLDMENALHALWKQNIYAETAMGCTGPVVRTQAARRDKAFEILKTSGFI